MYKMDEREPKRFRPSDPEEKLEDEFNRAVLLIVAASSRKRSSVWAGEGEDDAKRALYTTEPPVARLKRRVRVADPAMSVPKKAKNTVEGDELTPTDWLSFLVHVSLSRWVLTPRAESTKFKKHMTTNRGNDHAVFVSKLPDKVQTELFFMFAMRDNAILESLPEYSQPSEEMTDIIIDARDMYDHLRTRETSRLRRFVFAIIDTLRWNIDKVAGIVSSYVPDSPAAPADSGNTRVETILRGQARLMRAAFGTTVAELATIVRECGEELLNDAMNRIQVVDE